MSPSSAVTVTKNAHTPPSFITAVLWIQLESPCMTYKHFEHLANVCLLGTFFLFLEESGMQNIAALLLCWVTWLAFGKVQKCRICIDSFSPRNLIFTSLFNDKIDEIFQTLHCNTLWQANEIKLLILPQYYLITIWNSGRNTWASQILVIVVGLVQQVNARVKYNGTLCQFAGWLRFPHYPLPNETDLTTLGIQSKAFLLCWLHSSGCNQYVVITVMRLFSGLQILCIFVYVSVLMLWYFFFSQ